MLFSTIGAVLTVLLLGVAMTSWGMVRARRAEHRAAEEARIAQTVNDFLNDDLLAAVAPSKERGRGKDVSMREVLDVAAKRIDEEAAPGGRLADLPRVEGSIRTTLGTTYEQLGDYAAAEPHFQRALALAAAHGAGAELAEAYANVALLAYHQGRYDDADSSLSHALEIWPGKADDPEPITWRMQLANLARAQGRSTDAEAGFQQVLAIATVRGDEGRAADAMAELAALYQKQNQNARAESLYVTAIDIRRRLFGDDDAETVQLMNNLANAVAGQGRMHEAVGLWERTLAIKQRLYGESHPTTLNTLNNRAEAREMLGDYEAADSLHARVVAARVRTLGDEHPDTVRSRLRLAYVRMKLGRLADASTLATNALDVLRRTLGADHPATIDAEDILGTIRLAEGRGREAATLLECAYRRQLDTQPEDDYTRSLLAAHLGLALASLGRREEAEAHWKEALSGLPSFDAETKSIFEAIAARYETWYAVDPTRGDDVRAAEWNRRASEVGATPAAH